MPELSAKPRKRETRNYVGGDGLCKNFAFECDDGVPDRERAGLKS